jgi:hypothetical protein
LIQGKNSLSHIRKDDGLIQVQVGEVTQLLQQLQEKNEVSFSLSQHLKDLHTQENPDNQQDQGEQLAEACRVVESFVYMISAGKLTTTLIIPRSPVYGTFNTFSSNTYQMSWFPITSEVTAECTQPQWEQSGEMHRISGQSIPNFSLIHDGWHVVFGAGGVSIQCLRKGGRFLEC